MITFPPLPTSEAKRKRVREQQAKTGKVRKKLASPRKVLLWVVLAGLVFGLLGLGEPIDLIVHTGRAIVNQRPASDNIVIVKIDDASLRSVGNWPWSRRTQAKLVDQLSSLGSRQIVYDIMFAFPTDPQSDGAFADALRRAGRVTIGVNLVNKPKNNALILPELQKHTKVADIFLPYSWDGRVHEIRYGVPSEEERIPSLSTAIAGLKVFPDGTYPLDYSVDPRTFSAVSAGDLIAGKVDPKLVKGKIALIGTTTDNLGDQFILPHYGRLGGVYIHALGAETLMRGRPFAFGWIPGLLLAIGFCALSVP